MQRNGFILNRVRLFIFAFLLLPLPEAQGDKLHLPEVGDHFKLFTFEKNENPQNIIVVYTKLRSDCQFQIVKGKPVLDFYWLMNGKRYKPTHPLIKSSVRKRIDIRAADPTELLLRVNDLHELGTKTAPPPIKVKTEKSKSGCRLVSLFHDEQKPGKMIDVWSIYSESEKTFLPPFRKLLAITIRGTVPPEGETVQRKFLAK